MSPTLSGGVLTVPGQYGQAWQIAESTTNYYPNPIAANAAHANLGYTNITVTRITDAALDHPTAGRIDTATRIEATGTTDGYIGIAAGASTSLPVAQGQQITVGMWVRVSSHYVGQSIPFRLLEYGGVNGGEYAPTRLYVATGNWQYVENTITINRADRTSVYAYFTPATKIAGSWIDYTAVQYEAKAYATPFVHGSLGAGHAWTGTAHASSSTRAAGYLTINPSGWLSPSRGALMVRAAFSGNPTYPYLVYHFNSGNRIYIARNANKQVYGVLGDGGSSGTRMDATALPDGQFATLLLEWDNGIGRFFRDGVQVGSDMAYTGLSALSTTLYFGLSNGSSNGPIESALIFDRPLTPDEREQLTTMPRAWEWDYLFPPDHPDVPAYRSRVFLLAPRIYTADRDNRLGSEITHTVTHAAVDADIDRAGPKGQLQIAATDPAALPANGWIAPFLDVTHEDGTLDSAQMGLYQLDQPEITYDMTGQATASATGVDIVGQLEAWPLGTAQTTPVGANVMQAVRDALTSLGLTRHALPNDPRTSTTAISHGANMSWLARINDLLAAIGYHALYATAEGRLTSRPLRDARSDTAARSYATGRDSAIVDPVTIRRAAGNLYNVVVAVKEDFATGTALVAEARNDDPEHPWSTVALGREVAPAQPLVVMEAVDQDALQAIADDRLARASMQETLAMALLPDPTLAVHDVIEITGTDGPEGGRWSVESLAWGLTADSPLVRLGARRTYTTSSPEGV